MKKYTFIITLLLLSATVYSQTSATRALGVRFGGGDGVEAEISFQNYIGGNNRLEFDLGLFNDDWNDGFKFTLMYHWVGNIEGGLNWYIGAGGSVGVLDVNENNNNWDKDYNDGMFLSANGQLGIEYNFPIPLQISLDARPEFGLINDDFDFGYGLGVRYTF